MKFLKLACTATLALTPQLGLAQQLALSSSTDAVVRPTTTPRPESIGAPVTTIRGLFGPTNTFDAPTPASSSSTVSTTMHTPPPPPWQQKFDRFVDLKEADFALRYRSVFDSNNAHEYDQGQQRSIFDGNFKFDKKGKYSIGFHASTGHYFNWAYADFMGGGTKQAKQLEFAKFSPLEQFVFGVVGMIDSKDNLAAQNSGGWAMYVRRLYLDVKPIEGVEAQYGSFDIDRGDATEITTYDNDGWISGERLMLEKPHTFFFDEASVTYAYFGDIYTPNFFARGERLAQSNYHQFLLRKRAFQRVDASFDYTWQVKSNTLREAFLLNLPETRALDTVRMEVYQRLNAAPWGGFPFGTLQRGKGYAVTGDKKLGSRVSLEGGVANIDQFSVILTQTPIAGLFSLGINGDQYGVGKRFFVRPTIKLTPYLEATGFYTHAYGIDTGASQQVVWNKEALNAGLIFDIKKAIFPHALVR